MLRARHVASAAGAWTDRLRELAGGRSAWRNVHSKGIHVFVPRERIPMETGVLARTEKSVLFVIPWQGGWLIGDTDTPWSGGADQPVATGADVDYLLAKTNALLAEPLRRDDVHGVTVGLRPLIAEAARSRHDAHQPPARGRVAGARADHDRRRQVHDLPRDGRGPDRRGGPGAGEPDRVGDARRAAAGRRRGPRARRAASRATAPRAAELVALIDERPELAEPLEGGGGHLRAEVVHACTHEGALHLEDVLERRTRLALTAQRPRAARRRRPPRS